MGRLFSLLKGVESSLRSRLGMWMQEVSLAGDSAASAIAALQGQNVIPDGTYRGQELLWDGSWGPSSVYSLQTLDAGAHVLSTYTPEAEEVTSVIALVSAKDAATQDSAVIRLRASFTTHLGVVSQVGTTDDLGSDADAGAAAWTATITTDGTSIFVSVQDPGGATVDWLADVFVIPRAL